MNRIHQELADNVHRLTEQTAQDPSSGFVRPLVHTELETDVQASSRFTQYGQVFEFRCDESVGRGGQGSAPSPLRYLLSSIAFCVQVWCAKTAALRAVELHECHVDVETFMDMRGEHLVDGIPPHPQWFVLDVQVRGPGSARLARELVQDATSRCPVTSLVRRAVPVAIRVRLDGEIVHDTTGDLPSPAEPIARSQS